jgi:two-component sensor histidine kinase
VNAILDWLFGTATFVPHGMCLLWRPDLVAIHAISDLVIAGAYFAIPTVIWQFVRARPDLMPEHRRLAVLFSAFIMACGLTHVAALVTLWEPLYGVQALIKIGTAAVSVVAAATLWRLAPQLISLPSPAALQLANTRLQSEVTAHQATLRQLEESRANLERLVAERTEDLRISNTRFEKALTNSNIVVTEQNAALEYIWAFNARPDLLAADPVGQRVTELAPQAVAADIERFKQDTLQGGVARREVFDIVLNGETFWFDIKAEPVLLRDGEPGLITTSADITDLKRQQAQLQTVMRELNHRSKNLLAIVQAIARQTAISTGAPEDFTRQLAARLQALAKAHDVLVQQDWSGADLGAVVEGQIGHLLQSMPQRITIEGECCALRPESAHYLALALHELGSNAAKYGALSNGEGRVDLTWGVKLEGEGRWLELEWRERGGPDVGAPVRSGFGRMILEKLAPSALQGVAVLAMDPAGVRWTLRAPLPAV